MLITRSGVRPTIDDSARIATTAVIAGNVAIGPGCHIDHGAIIESSGPQVRLESGTIVMANAVVRSVGGTFRRPFEVAIGPRTLVGPLTSLVGCTIGADCYVATGVMVFQGAHIGAGTRLGAGSIVHVGTHLPPRSRVGLRHVAAAGAHGLVITAALEEARAAVADGDFFGTVFDTDEVDQVELHRRTVEILANEMSAWHDEVI